MGQKVHPYGFRIGVNKGWQSHWYAPDISYSKFVKEDYKLRKYINTRFKEAGVSKVEIERVLPDKISVSIYTAKPGVIIGKGGKEVESLKKELTEIASYKDIHVDVREVKIPEIDAALVAQQIAFRIEQRVSHRRAMKRAVEQAIKSGALGIKVYSKGRLAGAEIARKEWYLKGRVPLQTLRADIDYAQCTAFTKYGTIGIKVWIYKGDILKKESEE
ncbi:MAG TPA: 30S ribosomal protein S3 [Candidatus Hydrothermia bacterium]|mgnify:CR=1 FL=1|nr:30S ribosomal protein S3 [Candidatus Hydrothermae bacterium]MDD3648930.1 30S ribosomal protein S3 [Candidatus Hydrothermia bacterium]MDD5573396.1 30S ribosomal protein S3 [Candidatus Hydrothermia bacterium]HOK23171.1 30S ribosomal protein S3 [Candidatus Hydrothermia bacterium]HOL23875.1 30S ribosomal protein S3 [Candidatus Hydrothermia bacterium]